MSDGFTDERLGARAQIQAALYWYARAIDRGQPLLMRNAFHDDATVDCGAFKGDVAGFRAMLADRGQRVARSVHMIGNILIDFVDDDHAFAESYCLAIEEFRAEAAGQPALNRQVRVRYADDFSCRNGAWKIASHLIVVDHVTPAAPAEASDGFFSGPAATRDANDPILRRRSELGFA